MTTKAETSPEARNQSAVLHQEEPDPTFAAIARHKAAQAAWPAEAVFIHPRNKAFHPIPRKSHNNHITRERFHTRVIPGSSHTQAC
jgi:hypothetical protein